MCIRDRAYIADCLSLMLLSNAYEQFAKAVEEESSLYAIEPVSYTHLITAYTYRKTRWTCTWLFVFFEIGFYYSCLLYTSSAIRHMIDVPP